MSGAKTEIRAEDMPKDFPCGRCARKRCNIPCAAMRIFYADFMHRCRVAARVETKEREEIYRRYVEAQKSAEVTDEWDGLRQRMKENRITRKEVAGRIGVARQTLTFYMSMGASEAVAARIETAIEEILRERGE